MDAILNTLITAATNLVARISDLVTVSHTTNEHLAQLTAPAPVAPRSGTTFKPVTPKPYSGDPNRITAFIQELEIYFYLANIIELERKIYFALSLVEGGSQNHATIWADAMRSKIMIQQSLINHAQSLAGTPNAVQIPPPIYTNWESFAVDFQKQFGLFKVQEESVEAIKELEQGNMTCEEYAVVFNVHLQRSGYNAIAGLQEFKRGLNKALRNKLETTFPLPADNADGSININNWITRAANLDRHFRKLQRLNHGSSNANRARTNPPITQRQESTEKWTPPAKDPNAMDIDRTRRSGTSNKDTTCYHCQRKGHYAMNCPDKDKPKVYPARSTRIRTLFNEMSEEERAQMAKDLGF